MAYWVEEQSIKDLFDGDIFRAYKYVLENGECTVLMSKHEINRVIVVFLAKHKLSKDDIHKMTGIPYSIINAHYNSDKAKVQNSTINAIKVLNGERNPMILLAKRPNYVSEKIRLRKYIIENMLIEYYYRQGYSVSEVHKVLPIHIRKIQRIFKRLKEEE